MKRRNKKGWYGERQRHRASAYGIETTSKGVKDFHKGSKDYKNKNTVSYVIGVLESCNYINFLSKPDLSNVSDEFRISAEFKIDTPYGKTRKEIPSSILIYEDSFEMFLRFPRLENPKNIEKLNRFKEDIEEKYPEFDAEYNVQIKGKSKEGEDNYKRNLSFEEIIELNPNEIEGINLHINNSGEGNLFNSVEDVENIINKYVEFEERYL